jgi:hypothetical protein
VHSVLSAGKAGRAEGDARQAAPPRAGEHVGGGE